MIISKSITIGDPEESNNVEIRGCKNIYGGYILSVHQDGTTIHIAIDEADEFLASFNEIIDFLGRLKSQYEKNPPAETED